VGGDICNSPKSGEGLRQNHLLLIKQMILKRLSYNALNGM